MPLSFVQFSTQFVIELCCYIESYLLQSIIYVCRVRFACLHSYINLSCLTTKVKGLISLKQGAQMLFSIDLLMVTDYVLRVYWAAALASFSNDCM